MTDENENTSMIEWVTAGDLAEIVAEYDDDDIVSYNVYGKSDVEFDLGYSITDEQFKKFITAFQNDDVLNEVRAAAWMEALDLVREEVEG
jgi:hypothetical protein